MRTKNSKPFVIHLLITVSLFFFTFVSITAQSKVEVEEATQKVGQLFDQGRFSEAASYLAVLVKDQPNEPKLRFLYGFSLLAKSKQTDDVDMGKLLSAQALAEFRKAKELGMNDETNDKLIALLSNDSSGNNTGFSKNPEANKLMSRAESYFAQSNYDQALEFYQKALQVDPNLYEAALYCGDASTQKEDYKNAEICYQKAITINPNRETAYRYSATPLMKQKKINEARDRYVEAYITEPYSQLSLKGLVQWGQATGTSLGHPKIDVPEVKIGADGKATSTININPLADDGSMAWTMYVATRGTWRKEKFAKTFPAEKTYRHSLQEEAEALRDVIKFSQAMKEKPKNPNPQIETLKKLDQDGLLEAYILLAIPDEGIAADHQDYLAKNRAKLRQYVIKYVIGEN